MRFDVFSAHLLKYNLEVLGMSAFHSHTLVQFVGSRHGMNPMTMLEGCCTSLNSSYALILLFTHCD